MEEQEKQRLLEIAGKYEDCVYIEVSSVHSGSTLVYHLGDAVGIVNPGVHIGMFQDSVLYMKYATEEDPCALDFRYFPRGFGNVMETYSWSDNIKQAVIKNQKGYSLIFNHEEIAPGRRRYLPRSPIGRDCSARIAIMGSHCLQWGRKTGRRKTESAEYGKKFQRKGKCKQFS